jgi:hypothetical protein
MPHHDLSGFPRQINCVIDRFLDGQLSFDAAVAELTPLIKSWIERPKTPQEKAQESAALKAWRSEQPTIIAHQMFRIAEGRSNRDRKRATGLAVAAMRRVWGSAGGAA